MIGFFPNLNYDLRLIDTPLIDHEFWNNQVNKSDDEKFPQVLFFSRNPGQSKA